MRNRELSDHLTQTQIDNYGRHPLPAVEWLFVSDHLSVCEICRLKVEKTLNPDAVSRALKSEVFNGAEALSSSPESPWRRLTARLRPLRLKSPAFAFGSVFVLLLLAAAGRQAWLAFKAKPEISSTTPSAAPFPSSGPATMMIAQLNDGEGRITLDQEGKLSGVDGLPPAYREMIRNALTGQKLERSPLLAELSLRGNTPRGADAARRAEFSVIEPHGVVTLADRPTFRWSRMDGAAGYVVEVYDEWFNLAAASPRVTGASWATTKPLERGKIYYWQVKAFKDGAEFKAPQAKFRVLARSGVAELEQARRANGSSHLTLGLLYLKAGLLNEAEQEFRLLLKANPNSPLVQRLLTQSRTKS